MRVLDVPLDQYRALVDGCPDLPVTLTALAETGWDPTIRVFRVKDTERRTKWYVEAGNTGGEPSRVLILDSENRAAMAVAVPMFLADLLEDLKAELPEVFEVDGMREAIEKLVPWVGQETLC